MMSLKGITNRMSRGKGTQKMIKLWRLMSATLIAGAIVFTQPATAADILEAKSNLAIEINKGSIMRLARDAATVFVSDPSIVDVQTRSKKTLFLYGLRKGQTTLFALDKNDQTIVSTKVTVTHNLSDLKDIIEQLQPDTAITLTSLPSGLIVQGTTQTPAAADEIIQVTQQYLGKDESIINRLEIVSPIQVNLRIRIVEASRETIRALGVSWDFDKMGKFGVFGTTFGTTALPEFSLDSSNNYLALSYRNASNEGLDALIDAMDTQGMVSVLAEPNLTALSGETASFLAGGEFPVPVGVDDNEIEIQFKQFGVSLAFTPTVVSAERINLKLRSEVSQLSEAAGIILNSIEVPGLTTRRADTTIELASGQSFAVAGLLQNREVNDISKVPGLGSIPILGKLFQSRRYLEEETELIIIATPYLVQPVDPDTPLLAPADRGEASQQFEQLLESSSSNAITSSGERSRLNSPVGFIME